MATYYVRPDGSDSNTGTGSGTNQAWQTIQKALGATSGLVGGDIVYIAPGRYVELVTIGITSPSSQVRIVGDPTASQFSGLSAGPVRHTNIYANGTILGRQIITSANISNLSFENFYYQNGDNSGGTTGRIVISPAQNTQFKKCVFEDVATDTNHIMLYTAPPTSSASNTTLDSCIFVGGATQARLDGQAVSDSTTVKNCLFARASQAALSIFSNQVQVYNCTFSYIAANAINSNPNGLASTVKNCLFLYCTNIAFFISNNSTSWTYNRWVGCGGATNVTTSSGTNSANIGTADVELGYNLLHNIQAIWNPGTTIGSANTSFGNATSAPTVDMFGVAWSGTSPDAGAITYRNLQTITPIYQPTERNASTITIAPGSTSQSIELYLGLTGLTFSTSGLSAYYIRNRSAPVAITLVTQTATGAWTSGGFAEISSSLTPGVYRLDVPNAAFAAGASDVTIVVRGAAGTNGAVVTVTLSAGGLTAAQTADAVLDAVASTHNNIGSIGAFIQDKTGYSLSTSQTFNTTGSVGSVTGNVTGNVTGTVGGVVGNIVGNLTGSVGTVATPDNIIDGVWDEQRVGHTASGSFGEKLQTNAMADEMLARDLGSGLNAGTAEERTVRSALRALRNKVNVGSSQMVVKKEDDTTDAWTASVTTTAVSSNVSGIDPN